MRPTVTDHIENPGGYAYTDAVGTVRLVAAATGNAAGYAETNGGTTVVGTIDVGFDDAGQLYDPADRTRTVTDATIETTTITSATADFTPTDDNAVVSGPGIPWGTTISFVNENQATLSQPATSTGSGLPLTISDSIQLHPNSGSSDDALHNPPASWYEYSYKLPGQRPVVQRFTVPDVAGPLRVADIVTPGVGASVGAVSVLEFHTFLAADPDALLFGTLTRDDTGCVTVADVRWPDGTTGTYTTLVASTEFPGAVDSYSITYGTAFTFTQPTMSRNDIGAVVYRPDMVVT